MSFVPSLLPAHQTRDGARDGVSEKSVNYLDPMYLVFAHCMHVGNCLNGRYFNICYTSLSTYSVHTYHSYAQNIKFCHTSFILSLYCTIVRGECYLLPQSTIGTSLIWLHLMKSDLKYISKYNVFCLYLCLFIRGLVEFDLVSRDKRGSERAETFMFWNHYLLKYVDGKPTQKWRGWRFRGREFGLKFGMECNVDVQHPLQQETNGTWGIPISYIIAH